MNKIQFSIFFYTLLFPRDFLVLLLCKFPQNKRVTLILVEWVLNVFFKDKYRLLFGYLKKQQKSKHVLRGHPGLNKSGWWGLQSGLVRLFSKRLGQAASPGAVAKAEPSTTEAKPCEKEQNTSTYRTTEMMSFPVYLFIGITYPFIYDGDS